MNAAALVAQKRAKNALKWGEQNWPNGTGPSERRTRRREAAWAEVDSGVKSGRVTYYQILREEFAELACEADDERVLAELIDVAAVALDWADAVLRRNAAKIEAAAESSTPTPAATDDDAL